MDPNEFHALAYHPQTETLLKATFLAERDTEKYDVRLYSLTTYILKLFLTTAQNFSFITAPFHKPCFYGLSQRTGDPGVTEILFCGTMHSTKYFLSDENDHHMIIHEATGLRVQTFSPEQEPCSPCNDEIHLFGDGGLLAF